jgi:hypothetical protein
LERPTIVAAFPVTQSEVAKDSETNEALSDFEWYLAVLREPMKRAGIQLSECYEPSFSIQRSTRRRTVRLPPHFVGYYFFDQKGRIHLEKGVDTDTGLIDLANHYFHIKVTVGER